MTSKFPLKLPKFLCVKCGGKMKSGQALANTIEYSDDFGGDNGERGTTASFTGPAVMVSVQKCEDCGHSFRSYH